MFHRSILPILIMLVFAAGLFPCLLFAELPGTLYEEWRISPSPAEGCSATTNPPALLWASVEHWKKKQATYVVEISHDPSFPTNSTLKSAELKWCFFNLHRKLKPGTWHWRYTIKSEGDSTVMGPYSFLISDRTPVFESPDFKAFASKIPQRHPFAVTEGVTLDVVHQNATTHPLAELIIKQGHKVTQAKIYSGPVSDNDPAIDRHVSQLASKEAAALSQLVDGYLLTGDGKMKEEALKRVEVMLGWPTSDLLGSGVLTALARTYDGMNADLAPDVKAKILAVIDRQLRSSLSVWPGKIEGRQVENHFWQAELASNFLASIATFHELESARGMAEYTYGLFLARFPNLSTPDGAWAEGMGYFGVNRTAVVDMARLMKAAGGFNPFMMPWYQKLADYFIYFAPNGGHIDGFGDMHDRVGGTNIGGEMLFAVGQESGEPKALFRAAQLMKSNPAVAPWYQVIHNIHFDPAKHPAPVDLPESRVFEGVGLAAMHTNVLDAKNDTAIYFRSSPFGAKGHMHANQNAFNLSRRGEPLFYSTGFYTTFADAHSMSSYRHTRAHNAILINGKGQSFGHEGYGWIKRHLEGDRISYVCGDATMAYRKTVDGQFISMMKDSKIDPDQAEGDAKLNLFERHMIFVRPNTLIVYDVLAANQDNDWSLLLHTMKPPVLGKDGEVTLDTGKNLARAMVAGFRPLRSNLTDQFHFPPVDIKKKYGEFPTQYHLTFNSEGKSAAMRFLTIIAVGDGGGTLPAIVRQQNGHFEIGDIKIDAQLDASKPAALSVVEKDDVIKVNAWPDTLNGRSVTKPSGHGTLLLENSTAKVSEDVPPPGVASSTK